MESVTTKTTITVQHSFNDYQAPEDEPPQNFTEHIEVQEPWETDLLEDISLDQVDTIRDNLQSNDTLIVVSDGGLNKDLRTFGVAMGTEDTDQLQHRGIAHGNRELHSSYRAEAYGMLCALIILLHIIQFFDMMFETTKRVHLFCDNLSLVTVVEKHRINKMTVGEHTAADADVELQILSSIKALTKAGVTVSIEHVKGHQDKTKKYEELPRAAQLNVQADEQATHAAEIFGPADNQYQFLTACAAYFYIGIDLVTSKYKALVRR